MKTTAAILVETGKALELAELDVPALRPGQVLVEIRASALCHTQLLEVRGHRGDDKFLPHCLGHEGLGTVLEVGSGVKKVKTGDAVVLSWMKGSGADVSGTTYQWNGRLVNAGAITTLSRQAVISENRLTLIPASDLPKEDRRFEMAFFGCAVPTGLGIVFNTAKVKSGQSVAVFGVGGIGLSAIIGAAIAGASPIVAVDINPEKFDLAKKCGATHTLLNTNEILEDLKNISRFGLDVAIEATGVPSVMKIAFESVRNQGGIAVIAGNAKHGSKLEMDPRQFNMGKNLFGTWGGDNHPDIDFPKYFELYKTGRLSLAAFFARPYRLSQINEAFDDLEKGAVLRPLIDMAG